ncbi:hypothetical protein [Flavobacterium cheniae]|uniref:Uncharacterized protein n=1 Tax=Flavobacterium cheniae TaxID=295428 RepID=A0A562KS18_9FLAO|nr:hypothetical protein [Flavobacterium cheniae]TDR25650.1 hypothetical protein C8D80_0427 [Flavobacterium cheniae]TWH98164.1 hypothetical protein IP97_00109 [Flavobacterium cheniae]
MNKLIVYFLISVFMCANTSIGQLLKVPNLIEHYNEHKNELTTDSISFIDYIVSHYSKNAENNHDHQDLPFKTFDNSSSILFVFSMITYQIQVVKPLISAKKKFFYNISFESNLIASIWLPPKLF